MSINRHPRTGFLVNSVAPARISARRMTAGVDQRAELTDLLDQEQLALQPGIDSEPARPARILLRRFTGGARQNEVEEQASETYVLAKGRQ